MTVVTPWARHYQHIWEERAADPKLPNWLRVAALAYGRHSANGHAVIGRGRIALVLANVDTVTGEVTPLDRGSVQRAIRTAVKYGWLAPESNSACLVVPGHAISGGLGRPRASCPQHNKPRNVGAQRLHLVHESGVNSARNVGAQ